MSRFCKGCGAAAFSSGGWPRPSGMCGRCEEATPNVRAACQALSRFAVFMWMEALRNTHGNWKPEGSAVDSAREWAFKRAALNGYLRVTWPEVTP